MRFSDVSSLATDWSEKGTVSVDGAAPSRVTDPTEIAEGHCISHTTGAEMRVPFADVAFQSPGFAIYELIEPNVPADRKVAEYREPGASACRSAFLHAEPPKLKSGRAMLDSVVPIPSPAQNAQATAAFRDEYVFVPSGGGPYRNFFYIDVYVAQGAELTRIELYFTGAPPDLSAGAPPAFPITEAETVIFAAAARHLR